MPILERYRGFLQMVEMTKAMNWFTSTAEENAEVARRWRRLREIDRGQKKTAPELPTAPLRDLLAWWKSAKVSGAIIGGLAVALYTKPRATRDMGAVIDIELSSLASFLNRGESRGFRSRIPDPIPFAAQSRMVIVTHEESGIDVDMAIAGIPYETDAIARARRPRWRRSPMAIEALNRRAIALP